MRVPRSWTDKPWCEKMSDPEWPLAYSKYIGQGTGSIETKGRVNSNLQDLRHSCDFRGVESKCHRCRESACGAALENTCGMQLQGVASADLSINMPTVSDTPWAVGGAHRNDFDGAGATHTCLMLSGGECIEPDPAHLDYSSCRVQCWGFGLAGGYIAGADNDQFADPSLWDYKATDVWEWAKAPHNPQGILSTLAGGGGVGYADGSGAAAKFSHPQDVAVDASFNVYVADTGNHRIRKVTPAGVVTTVAGNGVEGWQDGPALDASFSSPSGIALYHDSSGAVVLLVADQGNHRIRKVSLQRYDKAGAVSCYVGRCGPGTDSWTHTFSDASPQPGYADGTGDVARFDSPSSVAVDDDGTLFVADTNNHLVRMVTPDQEVYTLAGLLGPAQVEIVGNQEVPAPGCPPPCLAGLPGHTDGSLSEAAFYFPTDVALGPSRTVLVTEPHNLRRISLPEELSEVQGVSSTGRVVTLAGKQDEGENDGAGDEAMFNRPTGVTATPDGIMYVTDAGSCRIRRVVPAEVVALDITCSSTLQDIWRPSGCSSYDPPVGDRDKTVGSLFGNIFYNYEYRDSSTILDGWENIGREIKDCVGTPPPDALDKKILSVDNLAIDDGLTDVKEDTGDGSVIRLHCPGSCVASAAATSPVIGSKYFTDSSSICLAAVHAGEVSSQGMRQPLPGPQVHPQAYIDQKRPECLALPSIAYQYFTSAALLSAYLLGAPALLSANGVTSTAVPESYPRLFTVAPYPEATVEVQTISGHPAAGLEQGCGYSGDGQPPQEGYFRAPMGIDVYRHTSLTDSVLLYVADTDNHAVRSLSAVCAFPCENGAACVAPDTCACTTGWTGQACTTAICSTPCGNRSVCVAPDTCDCVPGFGGAGCTTPLCFQTCMNGGTCTAPDTCTCPSGWFGYTCEVPVCEQTCGNDSDCTAPNTCRSAPALSSMLTNNPSAIILAAGWTGTDCRIPTCDQTCANGGWCTAPNTCTCPPQWTGHDCSLPICHQGLWVSGGSERAAAGFPSQWLQHVPCSYSDWCTSTNGFDCAQSRREASVEEECRMMELEKDVITQFSYLRGDSTVTSSARYSPLHPYDYTGDPRLPWFAYDSITEGHTLPYTWSYDRQVAMVERHMITEGHYVCANDGLCISPGVCECADGWIGFDCRTPVCTQVSGIFTLTN
ncbi:unnamed protein product [Chrysoparadoxa australica]